MNDHVNGTMAGILNTFGPKENAPPSVPVQAVVGHHPADLGCNGLRLKGVGLVTTFVGKVYAAVWGVDGTDQVAHAMREAAVNMAVAVCHETGTEDGSVAFCAETIRDWMYNDVPQDVPNTRIADTGGAKPEGRT